MNNSFFSRKINARRAAAIAAMAAAAALTLPTMAIAEEGEPAAEENVQVVEPFLPPGLFTRMKAHSEPTRAHSADPHTQGPGSIGYPHAAYSIRELGEGAQAVTIFEPAKPTPAQAPVAVILHGWGEYSGHQSMQSLIENTVRHGTIVIYPRWQIGRDDDCKGAWRIEPCITYAHAGIRDGLAFIKGAGRPIAPTFDRLSYFGLSFGGVLALNIANRSVELGLPAPDAIFLDDPHDGGLRGAGEQGVDADLRGIPVDIAFICHSSRDGKIASKPAESCNRLFDRLAHVAPERRALVSLISDDRGYPGLIAGHSVCLGARETADAFDWGFCWRAWAAMRHCVREARDCDYAFGDAARNRYIGTWSNGAPVYGLQVAAAAPINTAAAPAEQPMP